MKNYIYLFLLVLFVFSCTPKIITDQTTTTDTPLVEDQPNHIYPQEKHLANMKQLTFGGDNAEAYFSFDNKNLVFQAANEKWDAPCDQIFMMSTEGYKGEKAPMLSTGQGRTTCSYFMPGNSEILYASTHLQDKECPESVRSVDGKYVWPIYESYDIFTADIAGW